MLLTNRNIHYTELKLNEDFTRETLNDLYPSATSFPVIVVDGFNIGGYNELNNMLTEEIQKSQKLLME
jgi:glutaredoxin